MQVLRLEDLHIGFHIVLTKENLTPGCSLNFAIR